MLGDFSSHQNDQEFGVSLTIFKNFFLMAKVPFLCPKVRHLGAMSLMKTELYSCHGLESSMTFGNCRSGKVVYFSQSQNDLGSHYQL